MASTGPGGTAPTWDLIKTYFRPSDIQCMLQQGLDLSDCAAVLKMAPQIYQQVSSGNMPLGGPPWSDEWVSNFKAWMDSNPTCPKS